MEAHKWLITQELSIDTTQHVIPSLLFFQFCSTWYVQAFCTISENDQGVHRQSSGGIGLDFLES